MPPPPVQRTSGRFLRGSVFLVLILVPVLFVSLRSRPAPRGVPAVAAAPAATKIDYQPRQPIETSGWLGVYDNRAPLPPDASLDECAEAHRKHVPLTLAAFEEMLATGSQPYHKVLMTKASLLHSQGNPRAAYRALEELEARMKGTPLEAEALYTVIYYKGLTGLRIGENENCVMCRGVSACIFPIDPAAVHVNPEGSRLAIAQFTEYLRVFPDDFEVRYLLNFAHMTLGEHPHKVDPKHRMLFDAFGKSEFDIGRFQDVSERVGLYRLNESGGSIMEDFDGDGLLDIVVTDWAPTGQMAFYRNKGDGTFENRTKEAGLGGQYGGLACFQTDYNNDGHMDIFVPRGAWMRPHLATRPSLLRNNGNGTFTDVTKEAGLATPHNSNSAAWGDYDNDGFLDVFVCGQHRPCALYRNKGDGTFEEVASRAGLPGDLISVLGAAWIDYDNDGYPDLFLNMGKSNARPGDGPNGTARLYHNNRNGTFTDVTKEMGIDGPLNGFSCWAFDYDNDGWLDIFATSTSHTVEDVVKGLLDQPHTQPTAKLYKNMGGKGFKDVTKEVGLDKCYSPMGSNFGDFDNDGYLDFYLATGDPCLSTLIPNRMFRNVGGKRFAEVTASSRTGHLQKGHSVAIGDWRRCGSVDLLVQLGGAVQGDAYHNVLFQNPGQGNNWLNVKLVGAQTKEGGGRKTNRAAIGARIKVVTAGENSLTVHRHVSSGSSFGANPLEQHIGLGKADKVALLEIHWPTSGTTQVFENVAVNQGIVVTEFASEYRKREYKPISLPK